MRQHTGTWGHCPRSPCRAKGPPCLVLMRHGYSEGRAGQRVARRLEGVWLGGRGAGGGRGPGGRALDACGQTAWAAGTAGLCGFPPLWCLSTTHGPEGHGLGMCQHLSCRAGHSEVAPAWLTRVGPRPLHRWPSPSLRGVCGPHGVAPRARAEREARERASAAVTATPGQAGGLRTRACRWAQRGGA